MPRAYRAAKGGILGSWALGRREYLSRAKYFGSRILPTSLLELIFYQIPLQLYPLES